MGRSADPTKSRSSDTHSRGKEASASVAHRHLDQAEDDLARAHQRIAQQRLVIEKLRQDGHDTAIAQRLLHTMEESAVAMEHHRNVILEELGLYRPGESERLDPSLSKESDR
jgi:hypothetical protein